MRQDIWIQHYCADNNLPESYRHNAAKYFATIGNNLAEELEITSFQVIGINGAQGTGKSTLAKFLVEYLKEFHNLRGCALSLDDFYLTKAEREVLAAETHTLLRTRGVPGTHDVSLAGSTIQSLQSLTEGQTHLIPKFDKLRDDRSPIDNWVSAQGKQDFIIFEGWCVGSSATSGKSLTKPINDLEVQQDSDLTWRLFVNEQLKERYSKLWALLDKLILLQAPNFEASQKWRMKQETKLSNEYAQKIIARNQSMSDTQIIRFMEHYERISRRNLSALPKIADIVVELDEKHNVNALRFKIT